MNANIRFLLICSLCLPLSFSILFAENVDPYQTGDQYGWSENAGWMNAEPGIFGMQVESNWVLGYLWGENIGWICLHCASRGTCDTVSYGIINDGSCNLSGFAWGENVGWINFDPDVPGDTLNQYRVIIAADGKLSGWAWGQNIGWMHFDDTQVWDVRVCIVTLEDLVNFASYWLQTGSVPANFVTRGSSLDVDMSDYAIFTTYWQDYCPDGWQLK